MSNSKAADVTGAAAEPTDNPPGPPNVGSPAVGEQPDGADGKQEREHWIHKAPKFIEAAKVWYCDVFNRRHWFQLCVFHIYPDSVNPSGFSYCPFGNETDEGKGETQKQECSAQ